ncbi:MAG: hypothetical protein O7H41_09060 [Planctomycetota bacterium]|nr:hypothetical protein [Planctomycetota bacterium]
MIILGGLGILWQGHNLEWFLGALATAALHNQTYFLAWAFVGVAYSTFAALIWIRCVRRPGRFRTAAGFLILAALMMAGSQVVARRVMHSLGAIIPDIGWVRGSQEFAVVVVSMNAAVAESLIRGDLQTIVSVEGLWWSQSEEKTSQLPLETEVEEIAIGAPDLLGQRRGTRNRTSLLVGAPRHLERVRLPWKPRVVGSHIAYVVRANAVFVNRDGKRVGGESTRYIAREGQPRGGWDLADPLNPRMNEFLAEARAWLSDPERNQAPFRVRPPPLPGVVREDVRPVKK